jgi:hypothetical protein
LPLEEHNPLHELVRESGPDLNASRMAQVRRQKFDGNHVGAARRAIGVGVDDRRGDVAGSIVIDHHRIAILGLCDAKSLLACARE